MKNSWRNREKITVCCNESGTFGIFRGKSCRIGLHGEVRVTNWRSQYGTTKVEYSCESRSLVVVSNMEELFLDFPEKYCRILS